MQATVLCSFLPINVICLNKTDAQWSLISMTKQLKYEFNKKEDICGPLGIIDEILQTIDSAEHMTD